MAFHLDIVTPEKTIFSGAISSVALPGADGELEVLPGHTALVTALQPGELRYQSGGEMLTLAIGSGFAEVTQEKVNVLTDSAMGEDQIDEAAAQAAMQRAEEQLAQLKATGAVTDSEEEARLQAIIASSMAQIRLKGRRRGSQ